MSKMILDKRQTGERLRKIIEANNFTYEMIAEKLDLTSPRVIYEWTSGKKLPCIENLLNLALILKFRLEDILVLRMSSLFLY